MKASYRFTLLVLTCAAMILAACAAPAAAIVENTPDAPAPGHTPAAAETWTLYTPASTSSIPVILAAQKLGNVDLVLYTSQEQANTLFARGEIAVLVTGLSVGVDLYRNEVPLQMANTYVSGLSYMVTYGKTAASFADLKGESVYVPFAGSPIEEIGQYLAGQQGLKWNEDITPVYAPFDSSVALLKEGKATAVVLPEPNVSLVESQTNVHVSFSFYDLWNENNPGAQGYPQVGAFVNTAWANGHAAEISAFNDALAQAIAQVQSDPAGAIAAVRDYYKLPEAVLQTALERTRYQLYAGAELQQQVDDYYQIIGKPLDENFAEFYYLVEK